MSFTDDELQALPEGIKNTLHKMAKDVSAVMVAHGYYGNPERSGAEKAEAIKGLEYWDRWLMENFV